MRISDWSSDVCSSDLATGRGAPSGESDRAPRRTRRRHRGGGDADQPPRARLSQPVVGLAVRRIAGDEQSRRGGCSDRKSAAYGKSVSVRVVLGGRRYYKKKNIK